MGGVGCWRGFLAEGALVVRICREEGRVGLPGRGNREDCRSWKFAKSTGVGSPAKSPGVGEPGKSSGAAKSGGFLG